MSEEQQDIVSLAERRAEAEARAAEARAREQAQRGDRAMPKPWLTWTLIGLNAAIWLVMVGLGVHGSEPSAEALVTWGGNLGILTSSGQWWRLLTAVFLHAGIIHLGFNLYFLWAVGRACEQIFGAGAYALVYFGSGLIASIVSVAWQPAIVSVGASGALFGVFGAFLGFTIRRRTLLPPEFVQSVRRNALILIGLNLVIGFTIPGIDVAAHIGGLVAGLGIGYAIARLAEKPVDSKQQARAVRFRAIGLTGAATLLVLLAGVFAVPRYDNPMPVLEELGERHDALLETYQTTEDPEQRAELIEEQVLPLMRESAAALAELDRVPELFEDLVDSRERYFEQQVRAFELELEALRDEDPAALAEADRLHAIAREQLE